MIWSLNPNPLKLVPKISDLLYYFLDQIDENLRTALQRDLLAMAPGLRVQVTWYYEFHSQSVEH